MPSYLKITILFCLSFVMSCEALAQEIDDVEADMDTAISESQAARVAEEYNKKRIAEEKERLSRAEKEAEEFSEKAKASKERTLQRVAQLEKEVKQIEKQRASVEEKTKNLRLEIEKNEKKILQSEERLKQAQAERALAQKQLDEAQSLLKARKVHLSKINEQQKNTVEKTKNIKREMASVSEKIPGSLLRLSKDCTVWSEASKQSKKVGQASKGSKVTMSKATLDGWYFLNGGQLKGFVQKSCD